MFGTWLLLELVFARLSKQQQNLRESLRASNWKISCLQCTFNLHFYCRNSSKTFSTSTVVQPVTSNLWWSREGSDITFDWWVWWDNMSQDPQKKEHRVISTFNLTLGLLLLSSHKNVYEDKCYIESKRSKDLIYFSFEANSSPEKQQKIDYIIWRERCFYGCYVIPHGEFPWNFPSRMKKKMKNDFSFVSNFYSLTFEFLI